MAALCKNLWVVWNQSALELKKQNTCDFHIIKVCNDNCESFFLVFTEWILIVASACLHAASGMATITAHHGAAMAGVSGQSIS